MNTVIMIGIMNSIIFCCTGSIEPIGVIRCWMNIVQQMITNKLIGPAQVRTVRPPAERQMKGVKSAGAGKTEQAKERNS